MNTKEKIVSSTLFVIGIIIISISAYNLYQGQKEYKEQQKVEQKVEQEIKAKQVKAAKLLIKQLEKKNINNFPTMENRTSYEVKSKLYHKGSFIYDWAFVVDDDSLYSYIVKPVNNAIGKEKYNKKNSKLYIELVRNDYIWYISAIRLNLNEREPNSYYSNFSVGIIFDKEMMDNAGIVLW